MDFRAIFTVIPSRKEYPPINIAVQIPEELARKLMATPVGAVQITMERSGPAKIIEDKTPLLDFKGG